MGLLGQILGGLVSGAVGGRSPMGRGRMGGMSPVLMALLPVVLGMLRNRATRGAASGASVSGNGGGLDGMGGLGGLLQRFNERGYGAQSNSWVGTGANEPLPEHAIADIFGDEQVSQIAQQAGVSETEARSGLSQLLPEVVDHFTPDGTMPQDNELAASVDEYLKRLN